MLCPMYYVCKAVPLTVEHIFFFDPHAPLHQRTESTMYGWESILPLLWTTVSHPSLEE